MAVLRNTKCRRKISGSARVSASCSLLLHLNRRLDFFVSCLVHPLGRSWGHSVPQAWGT